MSVALIKWTGTDTVAQAVEAINGWDGFKPGMRVLIKPNVVASGSKKMPSRGITSSPVIVAQMALLAREKGAANVVIAEGAVEIPSINQDTQAAYEWSGIAQIAQDHNISLIDMNKGPFRSFTLSDGTQIEVAEAMFEADFVISIPLLKTHGQAVATLSLKNLKGALSMESKKRCHTETNLNKAIAEFNRFVPCHLVVLDALTATEFGPLPSGRKDQVKEMGLLMAGKDRLELDVVGSFLLGKSWQEVPAIRYYAELTGRTPDIERIHIVGEDPAAHRIELGHIGEGFEDLMKKFNISGISIPYGGEGLCSGCGFNLFAGLFSFFRGNAGLAVEGVQVCTGPEVKAHRDCKYPVLLGKCAIKANKEVKGAVKVGGCPPDPEKIQEAMAKTIAAAKQA